MYRIYFKLFNSGESEREFDLLEEACIAFFRNLGPSVHKIELYENLAPTLPKNESVWRPIILARRDKVDEPFRMTREFNIF